MKTFYDVYDKLAGGTVGNWLAIVGLLSLIYWGWLIVAALQNRAKTPAVLETGTPAAKPSLPSGPPAEDIAVIAAAVHAMLGTGRIIHLIVDEGGRNWANEGRWIQQTSHKTR